MIPPAIFVFKYEVESKSHPGYMVQSQRLVRACGYDEALEKFKEEFLEWGEPVPSNVGLYDIFRTEKEC